MKSLTTQSVTVSAESFYQDQYSNPDKQQYVYAYRIAIANNGRQPVKLLSRAWDVTDATGNHRHVEGEGVVGQQPVIMPGQCHEYTSWVQFKTPIGSMQGSYIMADLDKRRSGRLFQVEVPRFMHISPETLN